MTFRWSLLSLVRTMRTKWSSCFPVTDLTKGLKVPRSAIRFQGDQKGVYVILGKDVTFKKINVIYEGDDYVLSENTSNEDYLLLYDQILLEVVSDEDVQQSRSDSNAVTSG